VSQVNLQALFGEDSLRQTLYVFDVFKLLFSGSRLFEADVV
jgi:hypothetical protein